LADAEPIRMRIFRKSDTPAVVALWQACDLTRPWNDPHKDIARKLAVQSHLFLVATQGERVVGSVMAGYDGHRGWVNYLAVQPELQRRGIAKQLMLEAEKLLLAAGAPKVNLQIRATNLRVQKFYQSLGYQIDEAISMGKRLVSDE
jgi:ribosomal protein S18 acetylase RimI-like enzyme